MSGATGSSRSTRVRRGPQAFAEVGVVEQVREEGTPPSLEPGSMILVARKGETDEVDMTVIPGEVTPEQITVPPEVPAPGEADEFTSD